MISQRELVESFFGHWPEFADADIKLFTWARGQSIELELMYGEQALGKSAVVGLRFTGVRDIDLTEFRSQNVLDCLRITPEEPIEVELEACYGLGGTFKCSGIEVIKVAPHNSYMDSPTTARA